MRGKYQVNHQILAGLDLGGQVLLLNKDRLSTLFKALSFDWKWLKLFYSIFLTWSFRIEYKSAPQNVWNHRRRHRKMIYSFFLSVWRYMNKGCVSFTFIQIPVQLLAPLEWTCLDGSEVSVDHGTVLITWTLLWTELTSTYRQHRTFWKPAKCPNPESHWRSGDDERIYSRQSVKNKEFIFSHSRSLNIPLCCILKQLFQCRRCICRPGGTCWKHSLHSAHVFLKRRIFICVYFYSGMYPGAAMPLVNHESLSLHSKWRLLEEIIHPHEIMSDIFPT